jgi:ribonuclease R
MDDPSAEVLALIAQADYDPMTLKAMARHFRVNDEDYPGFRNAVKSLIKSGKLDLAKNKTLRKGAGRRRGRSTAPFAGAPRGLASSGRRARPTRPSRSSSPTTLAVTPRPATR